MTIGWWHDLPLEKQVSRFKTPFTISVETLELPRLPSLMALRESRQAGPVLSNRQLQILVICVTHLHVLVWKLNLFEFTVLKEVHIT